MACGVAMVASQLSSTRLQVHEHNEWQLFDELFSWLVAEGGVGISGCLNAEIIGCGLGLTDKLASNLTRYYAGSAMALPGHMLWCTTLAGRMLRHF